MLKQKLQRAASGNAYTKKYEKTTHKGFLMRVYRNMKSRVNGIQYKKAHLYINKYLLPKEEFYAWALGNPEFYRLYSIYAELDYQRKLAPSVDRIDSSKGYSLDNMEWVTMGENSRRGNISRHSKNTSSS